MRKNFGDFWVGLCVSILPLLVGCEQQYDVATYVPDWNYAENPAVYVAGRPIHENTHNYKGRNLSISPVLAKGLTFDPVTGIISGTPVELQDPVEYTVSTGKSSIVLKVAVVDGIAPVVTSFTLPATSTSLDLAIESFEATDDFGVTGYCVTESDDPSGCEWSASAQPGFSSKTLLASGEPVEKALYAFARDRAGNISIGKKAALTLTLPLAGSCGPAAAPAAQAPVSGFCSAGKSPTAVSGSGPWTWTCAGVYGGASAACKAELLGKCGAANGVSSLSAPASGLCGSGTGSSIAAGESWTWNCAGSASGLSSSCSAPIMRNGACGASNAQSFLSKPTTGLCSTGAASSVSGTGPWSWSCQGVNSGSTANCSAQLKVNGTCGSANGQNFFSAPASNLCASGVASSISGSGPWTWSCAGANGGATPGCKAGVIGKCGSSAGVPSVSAPAAGLCSSGTSSAVTGGANWAWTCSGSSAELNAACSAPVMVNGACGSSHAQYLAAKPSSGLCSAGTASTVSGTGPWTWNCAGTNSGSTANCSAQLRIDARCGTASGQNFVSAPNTNLCGVGVASPVAGSGPWTWSCAVTTGSDANCSANRILNGQCGTASGQTLLSKPTTGLCAQGAASAVSGTGPWTWGCSGTNGGSSASCSAEIVPALSAAISQIEVGSEVTLYVSVKDPSGNVVTGLNASNFTVSENSVSQTPITVSASGTAQPVSVALTLDYSGSMDAKAIDALESASSSFVNGMGTYDEGEIIKFASNVSVVQAFTRDRNLLASKIAASYSEMGGATAFYDAVGRGLSDLTVQSNSRKAVIAMTDGGDNYSDFETENTVTATAQCKQIPIITVGLGAADRALLQRMADNTGGLYYYAPSATELAGIYSRISGVINNQYVIRYTSTNVPAPASRTVTIQVSASGYRSASATKTRADSCN